MPYFSQFNKINYTFDSNHKATLVNITQNIILKNNQIRDTTLYFNYNIQDGEKAEHISNKFYRTPEYHYIILLLNDIINPYFDWCVSGRELESFINDKYGSTVNDVHHYIDLADNNRQIDDYDSVKIGEMATIPANISIVTNRDHEIALNEGRRLIKLISSDYILEIVEEFEGLF